MYARSVIDSWRSCFYFCDWRLKVLDCWR